MMRARDPIQNNFAHQAPNTSAIFFCVRIEPKLELAETEWKELEQTMEEFLLEHGIENAMIVILKGMLQ